MCTHKVPLCSISCAFFFFLLFFSFQWLIIIGKLTLITVSLTLVYRACEIITQLNFKSDIFKWLNMSKNKSIFPCSMFTQFTVHIYLKLNWAFQPCDFCSHFKWIGVVTEFFEMKSIKLIQCQLNWKEIEEEIEENENNIFMPLWIWRFIITFVWDSSQKMGWPREAKIIITNSITWNDESIIKHQKPCTPNQCLIVINMNASTSTHLQINIHVERLLNSTHLIKQVSQIMMFPQDNKRKKQEYRKWFD